MSHSHPAAPKALKYRRDIDGLRAFAVMPVLLFHFGVHQISGGFAGVDVFFVISGYLIAGSLLADLEQGTFSLANFYWRRFRRILPALMVVVALSTCAAYFLIPAKQFVQYGWSLLAASTFWSNIYFWDAIDYFSTSADLTPLLHTWSLAVEEQYYLFAPIAMYLIYRFLGARWALVLIPLILASFALSWYGLSAGPRFTFYWLPTRAWELMLGAYLMLSPLPKLKSRFAVEIVGLVGLFCLGFAYFTLKETSAFPGPGALLPCLGTALLIYAGEHADSTGKSYASRLLELKPFVWIGLISYSLYLVHWPLVSFATHLTLRPVNAPVMLTLISILLAAALWKWVEQPFRTHSVLKTRKLVFVASFVSIALAVLVSFFIISKAGFPGRPADYEHKDVAMEKWRNGTCFFEAGQPISAFSETDCTHDLGFDDTKILLWGDSYAAQYVSGLAAVADKLGSNVMQITFAGCPPLMNYSSSGLPACAAFNRKAMALATNGDFSVVLLTGRWDLHRENTIKDLQPTLEHLVNRGLKVVVIGQAPRFIDDVQRISKDAQSRGKDPWHSEIETRDHIRTLLETQAAAVGQPFINPIELLCDGLVCPLGDGTEFYAFDSGHMGTRGASVALTAYLDALLPAGETLKNFGEGNKPRSQ